MDKTELDKFCPVCLEGKITLERTVSGDIKMSCANGCSNTRICELLGFDEKLLSKDATDEQLQRAMDRINAQASEIQAHIDAAAHVARFGPWKLDPNEVEESIKRQPDRLQATIVIFESLAIHGRLFQDSDQLWSAAMLADAIDLPVENVDAHLEGAMSSDNAFVQKVSTDLYRLDPVHGTTRPIIEIEGNDLYTNEGRLLAAQHFLNKAGISQMKREQSLEEVSPALHIAKSFIQQNERKRNEAGMLRIAQLKRPTWAGAKAFNESYARCVEQALMVQKSGKDLDDFNGLTQLYTFAGATMYDTPVMTIGTDQILALPQLTLREQFDFMLGRKLPFHQGIFLDFAKSGGDLPSFKSDVSRSGYVGVCGALVQPWQGDACALVIPFWVYGDADEILVRQQTTPAPMGIMMYQIDPDVHSFSWNGQEYPFETDAAQVLVAHSDVLDTERGQKLSSEYRDLICLGAEVALRVMYFVQAANVTEVDLPLEKRDRKRAEKRGWSIPKTVRIERPKRRTGPRSEPTGEERIYSHQWMVRGFYRHVTKGTHVRCQICKGEPHPEMGCSACGNTGLDPEKVKPCIRRFEDGPHKGELTCPSGCRLEFTPDHVRGNPDAPLVMKTYDIKAA